MNVLGRPGRQSVQTHMMGREEKSSLERRSAFSMRDGMVFWLLIGGDVETTLSHFTMNQRDGNQEETGPEKIGRQMRGTAFDPCVRHSRHRQARPVGLMVKESASLRSERQTGDHPVTWPTKAPWRRIACLLIGSKSMKGVFTTGFRWDYRRRWRTPSMDPAC